VEYFVNQDHSISLRWQMFGSCLDERQQRIWAGVEAASIGYGGVSTVARATGMSRKRVQSGLAELEAADYKVAREFFENGCSQREGGAGRKALEIEWPSLSIDLIAQFSGGHLTGLKPASFMWTAHSTRELAKQLEAKHGRTASPTHISNLLKQLGFRIRRDPRVKPLHTVKDRQAQFGLTFKAMQQAMAVGQAVLVLDIEKRHWSHCAVDSSQSDEKLLVQSLQENGAWDLAEPDAHSAAFALDVVQRWWDQEGSDRFAANGELLVCATGFEQEGDLQDYWINKLATAARELKTAIRYCHIPVGITRVGPVVSQPVSLLRMRNGSGSVVSHKVTLSVLPQYFGAPDLSYVSGFDSSSIPPRWRVPSKELKSINIRRDMEMGHWNFSVGQKPS